MGASIGPDAESAELDSGGSSKDSEARRFVSLLSLEGAGALLVRVDVEDQDDAFGVWEIFSEPTSLVSASEESFVYSDRARTADDGNVLDLPFVAVAILAANFAASGSWVTSGILWPWSMGFLNTGDDGGVVVNGVSSGDARDAFIPRSSSSSSNIAFRFLCHWFCDPLRERISAGAARAGMDMAASRD